mgnify:FL=1
MRPKLTVDYDYQLDVDDVPVRGNAIASEDDAYDREVEAEILERLDRGDVSAWAQVEVRAELRFDVGEEVFHGIGSAYLGGCSYSSEEELWGSILIDYDLREEARADAADDCRRQLTTAGLRRRFERDLKKLERDETYTWLLERQARATAALVTNPEWAAWELG